LRNAFRPADSRTLRDRRRLAEKHAFLVPMLVTYQAMDLDHSLLASTRLAAQLATQCTFIMFRRRRIC
jgi:hypothetical protein